MKFIYHQRGIEKHSALSEPLYEGTHFFRLEIESFLSSIEGAPVSVTGEEGRRALALAVDVTERIQEHAARVGVPFAG